MQIKVCRFFLSVFFYLAFYGSSMAQASGPCMKKAANGLVERPLLEVYNPVLQIELESIFKGIQIQSKYAAPVQIRVLAAGEKTIYTEAHGDISISIGFIQACLHKAELAFVLAHELAHLELRHSYAKSHYSSIFSENEVYIEKEADKRALELVKAAGYSSYSANASFALFTDQNANFKPIPSRFFPTGMAQVENQLPNLPNLPYDGLYEERQAIAERMKLLASRNSKIPTTPLDSLRLPKEFIHQANLELIQTYLMEAKPIRALQIWLSDSVLDLQMERLKALIVLQLASQKNAMALPMPHGMGNRELHQLESVFFRWTPKEVSAWALRHMFDALVRFPQDSALLRPLAESIALQFTFNGKQSWNAFSRVPFNTKKYFLLIDSLHKVQRRSDWAAWKRLALTEKLSNQLEFPVFYQAAEMLDSDWFLELKSGYQSFSPRNPTKTLDWFSGRGGLHPSLLLGTQWLPMDNSMLTGAHTNPSEKKYALSNSPKRAEGSRLICSDKKKLWDLCFALVANPSVEQIPANHLEILKIRKELGVRYLAVLVRNSMSENSSASQPYMVWLPSVKEHLADLPESKTNVWVVFIDLANYSIRFYLPLNSTKTLENPWDYAAEKWPF